MAQYRIAADLVALSKINELLEIKRRREDEAARIALLLQISKLECESPGAGRKFLDSVKVLENHGMRTTEAIITLSEIFKAFGINGGLENE